MKDSANQSELLKETLEQDRSKGYRGLDTLRFPSAFLFIDFIINDGETGLVLPHCLCLTT